MPWQRIRHRRITYDFPADFPERLERFKEESGLSWAEIARRLGTRPRTMGGRRKGLSSPSAQHMTALLDLADDLGLSNLFTV